jgi:hypothetical protein
LKVLGLTGGIGMGKSTAAATFRRLRVPVFDADAAVHRLQGPGGAAVRPIEAAFPGTTEAGAVSREALRARVLGDPAALARWSASSTRWSAGRRAPSWPPPGAAARGSRCSTSRCCWRPAGRRGSTG